MNGTFVSAVLWWMALAIGLTQGSHLSRDESLETDKTQFNLATTLTGDITNTRHHDRAHLSSTLYPNGIQPVPQAPSGRLSSDIDHPAAHESGGSGIGTLDFRVGPTGSRIVTPQVTTNTGYSGVSSIYPTLPYNPAAPAVPAAPAAPAAPSAQVALVAPTAPSAPVYPVYNTPGAPVQQPNPGYGYPGTYLPLPVYPYPSYSNYPVPAQPAPVSYQNQQHYGPGVAPQPVPPRYNHSFKMSTEYKEDGVHKGPFEVLNNHGNLGYGSGYGGGYNGAFNRPGY